MAKIIASPADLIQAARSRKAETLILLPHAYETAHSLRRLGSQAYIVASAPSIAGKIGILSRVRDEGRPCRQYDGPRPAVRG